jgi:hypothetical protein
VGEAKDNNDGFDIEVQVSQVLSIIKNIYKQQVIEKTFSFISKFEKAST